MSWRNKAQVFPASVSPTPGSPVCALTATEARPEQQLSSTAVLGKPVVLEMCLQIAWQISTLCFAEEFQLISFLKIGFPATPIPTHSSSLAYLLCQMLISTHYWT